jgi:hypothetical protein
MTLPIYSTFTYGSSTNFLTFNDEASYNAGTADYIVKARRRMATRRDIRDFDMPVPDEMGITDFQTLVGKTHYVIEGQVYSEIESGLFDGLDKVRKVFNPQIAQDDSESDYGYLPMKWTESENRMIRLKPLYVDIEENRRNAFKPTFRALLKIKYPVIISQTTHQTSFTPGAYGAGDGLQIPALGISIPATGISLGQNSGTSGSGVITNSGDYPAWPIIKFIGPVTNPKLSDGTNYIQVNTAIDAGEEINIQYDQDTLEVLHSDGTNLIQYLDSGSELFKIEPGSTQLIFTAQSISSPADCQVTIYDTWPLS